MAAAKQPPRKAADRTPVWLNVGCGPFRAPAPWLNLDVIETDEVKPDKVVAADKPLAGWRSGSVDRMYLGHVLEHVAWVDVPAFLTGVARALRPGGEVLAVGPDVFRVIRRWRDGLDPEGWELVESILEGPWDRALGDGYRLLDCEPDDPGARHHWNCFEDRLLLAFTSVPGLTAEALPITEEALAGWPVVAHTQWQCAVRAMKAKPT